MSPAPVPDKSTPLARTRLHPFVIVTGALFGASAGSGVWTLSAEAATLAWLRMVGGVVLAVGVLTLAFAYGAMLRARTTINPRRHTARLVTAGIFRMSRNPIYIGWFCVIAGRGLARASLFEIAVALAMIPVLHWAVVLREEEYLEAAFGDEYVRYRTKVPRWI